MIRLLLISDTHIPTRARTLPQPVWAAVEDADVVIHAGDWVDVQTLDELSARARCLVAVYGNNDGPPLRRRLPEVAREELGGLRLAVVHETGPAKGREQRCAAAFPDADVLVFGHSHIPWDTGAASREGERDHQHRAASRRASGVVDRRPRSAERGRPRSEREGERDHQHVALTGLRLLNPGSPTDRRRQPAGTFLTAGIEGGQLVDVTLHQLPPPPGVAKVR
jgi:putative phosphoesterase